MENTQNLPDYIVYTDGGCAINPGGHGAYAAIIIHTDTGEIEEYTNVYKNTTNNRMEIMAVIEAFEHIKKGTSVELHADSKYVLKTIDGQFSRKKNLDLWERLDKACEGLELSLCWVPGHRGHYYNERCDQMCTETMNNTNDLIVDSGYTGKKISTPRTVTGAMSVKIQVPKEFLHSKIEKLDVKKYQKKYQINRICAERLLEFRKEKKPKFKDYMMLQTGGKDNWSAMYLNQMIRHVENEELIIHTIKKYLSDEKAVNAAMRWYMRGLPLKYCIRKVLVDQEVAQSCNQKRK